MILFADLGRIGLDFIMLNFTGDCFWFWVCGFDVGVV